MIVRNTSIGVEPYHRCDKCGTEVRQSESNLKWTLIMTRNAEPDRASGLGSIVTNETRHLCPDCKTNFLLWMDGGFN